MKITDVTGKKLHGEYMFTYEFGTHLSPGETSYWGTVFQARLNNIIDALRNEDLEAFRTHVSLSRTNYVGKVTRSLINILKIKYVKNLTDLYNKLKDTL